MNSVGHHDPLEGFVTVEEAAELLRKSAYTVRLYMRQRKLRPKYVGRTPYLSTADLRAFVTGD